MPSLRIPLLAAAALLVAVPAANADTNVVHVSVLGVHSLSIEDSGSGSDANGVVVTTTPGGLVRVARATSAAYAPLHATGLPGCAEEMAGPDVAAVLCDEVTSDSLTSVTADLGAGDDLFDSAGVIAFGPFDPEHTIDFLGNWPVVAHLGVGDDEFSGGPLSDYVEDGIGADVVSAGAGKSNWVVQPANADPELFDAHDVLDSGSGESEVSYHLRSQDGVAVSLDGMPNDGAPGEDDNVAVTTWGLNGTAFDDTLIGSDSDQWIEAGPGDDVVDGEGGADTLYGDIGDDSLTGGAGNDFLAGQAGEDVLHAADGEHDRSVSCGVGSDEATTDARPLDSSVATSGNGCEIIHRPGEPVVTTPVTPAPVIPTPDPPAPVAPKLTVPKDAKVTTDSSGAVRLAFACKAVPCAAKKLTLKATVGKRTITVVVRIRALAAGEQATVKLKLSPALVKAIRKAGKRGVKVKLSGLTARPLALTLVKKR